MASDVVHGADAAGFEGAPTLTASAAGLQHRSAAPCDAMAVHHGATEQDALVSRACASDFTQWRTCVSLPLLQRLNHDERWAEANQIERIFGKTMLTMEERIRRFPEMMRPLGRAIAHDLEARELQQATVGALQHPQPCQRASMCRCMLACMSSKLHQNVMLE